MKFKCDFVLIETAKLKESIKIISCHLKSTYGIDEKTTMTDIFYFIRIILKFTKKKLNRTGKILPNGFKESFCI